MSHQHGTTSVENFNYPIYLGWLDRSFIAISWPWGSRAAEAWALVTACGDRVKHHTVPRWSTHSQSFHLQQIGILMAYLYIAGSLRTALSNPRPPFVNSSFEDGVSKNSRLWNNMKCLYLTQTKITKCKGERSWLMLIQTWGSQQS
jgi:hypothetical protein